MEIQHRSLTQERAILVAKQGDPQSPAPGTLLARQRILQSELEAVNTNSIPKPVKGMPEHILPPTNRLPNQIRRDIRRVEGDIGSLQDRLREIDQLVAQGSEKKA